MDTFKEEVAMDTFKKIVKEVEDQRWWSSRGEYAIAYAILALAAAIKDKAIKQTSE